MFGTLLYAVGGLLLVLTVLQVRRLASTRWRRPFFDGCYLTWDDLAQGPAQARPGPHSHEGRFHADSMDPLLPAGLFGDRSA